MKTLPKDHREYLKKKSFPIAAPNDRFLDSELLILSDFGFWMEALASRVLSPITPQQEHFVRVAKEESEPETIYEFLWVKLLKVRNQFQEAEARRKEKEHLLLAERMKILEKESAAKERARETRRFIESLGIVDWDFS